LAIEFVRLERGKGSQNGKERKNAMLHIIFPMLQLSSDAPQPILHHVTQRDVKRLIFNRRFLQKNIFRCQRKTCNPVVL
jgi:hypothetical protein